VSAALHRKSQLSRCTYGNWIPALSRSLDQRKQSSSPIDMALNIEKEAPDTVAEQHLKFTLLHDQTSRPCRSGFAATVFKRALPVGLPFERSISVLLLKLRPATSLYVMASITNFLSCRHHIRFTNLSRLCRFRRRCLSE